jgi:hypothetical protein
MTPSLTAGQKAKFIGILDAALGKSRLPRESTQLVLEHQGKALVENFLSDLRKRVEMICSVCRVPVKRIRTWKEALDATRKKQYVEVSVAAAMPRGEGRHPLVFFFKPGRELSDDELAKEYVSLGLKPVDPYSLAAINEEDPHFADEHSNGTHWRNEEGEWCCIAFGRWKHGERGVRVYRRTCDWCDHWEFAGVPI